MGWIWPEQRWVWFWWRSRSQIFLLLVLWRWWVMYCTVTIGINVWLASQMKLMPLVTVQCLLQAIFSKLCLKPFLFTEFNSSCCWIISCLQFCLSVETKPWLWRWWWWCGLRSLKLLGCWLNDHQRGIVCHWSWIIGMHHWLLDSSLAAS